MFNREPIRCTDGLFCAANFFSWVYFSWLVRIIFTNLLFYVATFTHPQLCDH